MVNAAIVGLGWWGKSLVGSVKGKTEDIKFVVGSTRSPEKAADFCRDNGIKLVDSFEAVVADPAVEAIVLATPHSQHGDQVRRAAAAGKHVFVEKPFTLTARDAEATLSAVDKAGIIFTVGFNRRLHPSMNELRKRIKDGSLGAIETCIGEQTAGAGVSLQPGMWRTNPEETPAGAMTGIGIHTVDALVDLFGKITEVYCTSAKRAAPHVEDTTCVFLKLANGATAMFFACIATVPNYRLAVYGSKGLAQITKPTLEDFSFTPLPDPKAGHVAVVQPEVISAPGFDTLQAELKAFAAAIGSKTRYPIPRDQILHGVEAFEAIVNSAKSGKPVTVG
jgi:predicted dehydrogenase